MAHIIRVTESTEKQLEAAQTITKLLIESGCQVAFLGGFAMSLLGSSHLHIELAQDMSINAAREMVMMKNPLFVKD
ncbi:hypothetical protein K435DRAFT_858751 [Dendrothele bispora CBS 962.96]|uniref:Uncharacterized protein n=1 Tax=Dendrothele bispora (strain CBS 962.96) TaxID=1314807 RepID=A0A4S8M2D8_DENBC|nr:hypothetical protein K435DRAFT_858751 [Dendrothele bispora CBS 962.96]